MTRSDDFCKIFSATILRRVGLCLVLAAAATHVLVKLWFGPAYVERSVEQSLLEFWAGPVRVGEIEFGYDGVMFIRDVSFYSSSGSEVMKASRVRMVLGNWPSLDAPAKRIEVERLDVRLQMEGAKPIFPLRQEQNSQTGRSSLEYFLIKNAAVVVEANESEMFFDHVFVEVAKVEGFNKINISREAADGRFRIEGDVNSENQLADIKMSFDQLFSRGQMKVLLSALGAPAALSCEGKTIGELKVRGNLSDANNLWPEGVVSFKDWTVFANDSIVGRKLGGELVVRRRHLDLERVKGSLYEGRWKGSFYADIQQSKPAAYGGYVLATDVNLAMLTESAGTEKRFTRGTGHLNLQFAGNSSGLESTKAYGDVFLHDADLWRVPLIGELFKSIGIWEYRLVGMSDAEAVFRLSVSKMTVERGHLSNRFSAIEAEPGGKVDLKSGQVDIYVVAAPLKGLDWLLGKIPVVNWFASFKDKLVRLRLKGNWSEPAGKLIHKQPLKDIKEGTVEFVASVVEGGGYFTEKLIKGFGLVVNTGNGRPNEK
jgi:hypothetical protein